MIRTDKGHFWLTFENGYTISVCNGYGSYSENHYKQEINNLPEYIGVISKDCEIAILYEDIFCTNYFIECNDEVKGFVSADELSDIIYKVKNYKGDSNAN